MITFKNNACGLGSNFLRMIDWLWYTKYSKEELYIDWKNDDIDVLSRVFTYENPKHQVDSKYYDHFVGRFSDQLDINVINERKKDIPFYDNYSMDSLGIKSGYFYSTPNVYFEKDFGLFRNVFNNILKQRFTVKDEFKDSLFDKKFKTLGVHTRVIDHYCVGHHNGPIPIKDSDLFFNSCAKFTYEKFMQEGFEKVYMACDIIDFYNALLTYFSDDQIIKIDYKRLTGNTDWCRGNRKTSEIAHNTFLDIFNLSKCDKLICGVSNFTLISLIINLNLEFEFFADLKQLHSN